MAMDAVIKVDARVVNSKLNSFRTKRQTLLTVMEAMNKKTLNVATVSWVSPASQVFLNKFMELYKQIEEAISIVDEYIHDLEMVIEQYTNIESVLERKSEGLRIDIFSV